MSVANILLLAIFALALILADALLWLKLRRSKPPVRNDRS